MATKMLPLLANVLCVAALHPRMSQARLPTHQLQHRSQQLVLLTEKSDWQSDEDWALLDSVPAYSAGSGGRVVTFWEALSAATPALSSRTAAECEARARELTAKETSAAIKCGSQPPLLEDWAMLPDGRYTGTVGGRAVWLTVEVAGRLASDPRPTPGYVEVMGGQVYELGSQAAKAPTAAATIEAAPEGGGKIPNAAYLAAVAVLTGVAGFTVGTVTAPPPPPPPPTKIYLAQPRPVTPRATEAPGLPMSASPPRSMQSAPLTVTEQRERAELRVERDKAKLKMLELKLQEDQQRLGELRRVEADRGPGADAVRMIFPPDAGPK